ncbi:hypothetical protein G9A89_021929 [Geosiphon pyriformis]|nr:hypothetical protein G9A89_021929 [Geosiphon pyriformis]
MVVHQLIPRLLDPPSRSCTQNLNTSRVQNPNSQDYLSLLVTSEDASTNNPAFTPKQLLTSNIPLTTIIEDKSLATIFPFEFKETAATPLFSEATLEAKPITAMYTDAKVKGQSIKLILDSGSAGSIITRQLMDQLGHRVDRAASARIITADGATKTPIGKIDDFPFEVNGIMTLIKVLVIETTQYQALIAGNGKKTKKIKGKEKKKRPPKPPPLITPTLFHNNLPIIDLSLYVLIVARNCHQWVYAVVTMRNTIPQQNFTVVHAYSNTSDDQRDKKNGITNLVLLYCDEYDLIYNPPPRIIYSIPEEEEPISSCTSESESLINRDSNSNNDDNNNGSSSVQIDNNDENDSDSDSKPNVNYEQYIALPDLSKKQELK